MNIKFLVALVMSVFFLFAMPSMSNANSIMVLEPQQAQCLDMVIEEASRLIVQGDTWEETLSAIAWQESHCNGSRYQTNGVVIGDLNNQGKPRSLGIMQVQLPTARDVGKRFPMIFFLKYGDRNPSDEELTVDLLIDDTFNIRIGVHYYVYLLDYRNGDWGFSILSYNRGTGRTLIDINDYVRKVKKWRKTVVQPYMKGDWKSVPPIIK